MFEKDILITNEVETAKNFNEHFINVISSLKLWHCLSISNEWKTHDKLVEKIN